MKIKVILLYTIHANVSYDTFLNNISIVLYLIDNSTGSRPSFSSCRLRPTNRPTVRNWTSTIPVQWMQHKFGVRSSIFIICMVCRPCFNWKVFRAWRWPRSPTIEQSWQVQWKVRDPLSIARFSVQFVSQIWTCWPISNQSLFYVYRIDGVVQKVVFEISNL